MAVVATECSGRCFLAEEKLTLKEKEAEDVSGESFKREILKLFSNVGVIREACDVTQKHQNQPGVATLTTG